jgi:mRNA interferase MazF
MTFKKWEIYRANLDPVIGSEQGKSRPVLIISEDEINNLINTINVIPITSLKEGRIIYPNESQIPAAQTGLTNESIALCHQIRTLDKKRLTIKYGEIVSEQKRNEILEALRFQLGL